MSNFVDCDRDQAFLLPPDLRDWIPADDLAHFVIEAVERVALGTFKVNHRGTGSAQYHPRMMLALLIYCIKGIEVNAYAAELARVSVWIGDIQWMRRNGFNESRDPILKPLETIECRDAILSPEGEEPEWPAVDAVIGNPPFLGGKLLIANLGEDYVSRVFTAYEGRVPAEADLVCYWFEKAGIHMVSGRAKRTGLVATNSIRGGANRRALQTATEGRPIFEAWSDEPWVIDGAAVRVSLVCFSRADGEPAAEIRLDGEPVDEIFADLAARRGGAGVDLTGAARLSRNSGVAFMGDTKRGPFDVSDDLARAWLRLPANPNGRPNADVLILG